jgi:hypothetical protein
LVAAVLRAAQADQVQPAAGQEVPVVVVRGTVRAAQEPAIGQVVVLQAELQVADRATEDWATEDKVIEGLVGLRTVDQADRQMVREGEVAGKVVQVDSAHADRPNPVRSCRAFCRND